MYLILRRHLIKIIPGIQGLSAGKSVIQIWGGYDMAKETRFTECLKCNEGVLLPLSDTVVMEPQFVTKRGPVPTQSVVSIYGLIMVKSLWEEILGRATNKPSLLC